MIILFSNTVEFWIPSFVLNDTSFLTWSTLPLIFILLLLLLISACLIIGTVIVMYSVRRLHSNATWILIVICGSWFECMLGLILIFPYKYGVLTVSDSPKSYHGFETLDVMSVELSGKCTPLIIGSCLLWHYIGALNGGFICFVIERSLATLLACDYETKTRKWIIILLFLTQQTIAISMCILFSFHIFSLTTWLFINAFCFACCVPYIFFLRQYNIHARNQLRLAVNITNHSLTTKFQTEENVRSMNIAARLATVATAFEVVLTIVVVLSMLEAPGVDFFSQLTEIVLFLYVQYLTSNCVRNPLFLIPAVANCVDDWRAKFLEFLPISRSRVDPNFNPYIVEDHRETAHIYFTQLHNLWT